MMHGPINIRFKFILFWNYGLSVHHQEFKTEHTATDICQTDTAVCLLESRQQYPFDKSVHLVGFTIEITRNILQREVKFTFSGASNKIYTGLWAVFQEY